MRIIIRNNNNNNNKEQLLNPPVVETSTHIYIYILHSRKIVFAPGENDELLALGQ